MAHHDDIFVVKFKDVEDVYWQQIPPHRRGMEIKIKRDKLDAPVFTEPDGVTPLKARTWGRYMKRLGEKGGSEENLTQKVLRRGTINAVNNKAPSSVRDQIADHDSNAVRYYINEIVEFDTAAAFLGRPSNEVVQREARLATFMADMYAPTDITDEQKRWISSHRSILRLRELSKKLTLRRKAIGYRSWDDAQGTKLYDAKTEVDKRLSRKLTKLRDVLKKKNKKRHFRDVDTVIFNAQLNNSSHPVPTAKTTQPNYSIPERRELVQLICTDGNLTEEEEHCRRMACIRLFIRWQGRQERPRRGRLAAAPVQPPPIVSPVDESIPQMFQREQCPFCVANLSIPRHERERPFSRVNKMWNHVEDIHAKALADFDTGKIPCSICKAVDTTFIPSSTSDFKQHTQVVHGIEIRNRLRTAGSYNLTDISN